MEHNLSPENYVQPNSSQDSLSNKANNSPFSIKLAQINDSCSLTNKRSSQKSSSGGTGKANLNRPLRLQGDDTDQSPPKKRPNPFSPNKGLPPSKSRLTSNDSHTHSSGLDPQFSSKRKVTKSLNKRQNGGKVYKSNIEKYEGYQNNSTNFNIFEISEENPSNQRKESHTQSNIEGPVKKIPRQSHKKTELRLSDVSESVTQEIQEPVTINFSRQPQRKVSIDLQNKLIFNQSLKNPFKTQDSPERQKLRGKPHPKKTSFILSNKNTLGLSTMDQERSAAPFNNRRLSRVSARIGDNNSTTTGKDRSFIVRNSISEEPQPRAFLSQIQPSSNKSKRALKIKARSVNKATNSSTEAEDLVALEEMLHRFKTESSLMTAHSEVKDMVNKIGRKIVVRSLSKASNESVKSYKEENEPQQSMRRLDLLRPGDLEVKDLKEEEGSDDRVNDFDEGQTSHRLRVYAGRDSPIKLNVVQKQMSVFKTQQCDDEYFIYQKEPKDQKKANKLTRLPRSSSSLVREEGSKDPKNSNNYSSTTQTNKNLIGIDSSKISLSKTKTQTDSLTPASQTSKILLKPTTKYSATSGQETIPQTSQSKLKLEPESIAITPSANSKLAMGNSIESDTSSVLDVSIRAGLKGMPSTFGNTQPKISAFEVSPKKKTKNKSLSPSPATGHLKTVRESKGEYFPLDGGAKRFSPENKVRHRGSVAIPPSDLKEAPSRSSAISKDVLREKPREVSTAKAGASELFDNLQKEEKECLVEGSISSPTFPLSKFQYLLFSSNIAQPLSLRKFLKEIKTDLDILKSISVPQAPKSQVMLVDLDKSR